MDHGVLSLGRMSMRKRKEDGGGQQGRFYNAWESAHDEGKELQQEKMSVAPPHSHVRGQTSGFAKMSVTQDFFTDNMDGEGVRQD